MMQLVQLRKIAMLRQGAVILSQLRNLFEGTFGHKSRTHFTPPSILSLG